ncbi:MAG: hypothetical protein J2P35_17220 [Actinobacteria bacterium]|nr:hypothetical protein [Actinomycetota bacterium]
MRRENAYTRLGWICLAIVGAGILGFGLVAAVAPASGNQQLMRADGLASIGVGLFGIMITWVPFRRQERWAWVTLWFYPLFWIVHLIARLPPGKDHIHQIVFIVLSLAGLLLPVRQFFPRLTGSAHR